MDRHHALGRKLRIGIEVFIMRVERDRHHVRMQRHQLDLFLEPGAGDAELHHRIGLVKDRFLQPLPALVIDARDLFAVGLHRFFQRANAVDMRNGRAGLDAVDILLRHAVDILLRRTIMIDRIRRPRIAGDGDDQLFHDRPSIMHDNQPGQRLGLRPAGISAGIDRCCNKKMEDDVPRLTMRLVTLLAALAAATIVGAVLPAGADDYPSRPIVLVIPLPPGGTNDIMARAVSDKMSAALGQQIVIENRNAGGSGTVGTRQVAHGTPDGYTIILGYTSTLATGPNLYRDVGYDPRKDFAPIGLIASAPALLLVYKDLPVHSVSELIALMKSSKEPFQVGTPGIGTVNYLASVLFAQQSGVKVEQIPEKGSNALNLDMMGGFV